MNDKIKLIRRLMCDVDDEEKIVLLSAVKILEVYDKIPKIINDVWKSYPDDYTDYSLGAFDACRAIEAEIRELEHASDFDCQNGSKISNFESSSVA